MGAVAPAQPVGTMGGMGTMQPMAGSMATGQGGFNAQPGRNAQMSMSGLTMGMWTWLITVLSVCPFKVTGHYW